MTRVITIFGSINLDLVSRVERLPRPGETVPGRDFVSAPGGKGANQALAAARAGAKVRMIGAVGSDGFAAEALSLLRAGEVDLGRVREVAGTTGVALILVEETGENVIAVVSGANGTLTASDAVQVDFAPGDVLLVQLEVPVSAIEAIARRARAAGAMVLLNFAPFCADALDLVRHATHLIVNETECAALADAFGMPGGEISEQAKALAAQHTLTTIVTLGGDGALVAREGSVESVTARAVEVVDTVGAGDTFCGYLAVALAEAKPLSEALAFAAAAGSLACTRPGAQPAIPDRRAVATMLGRGGLPG